MEATFIAFVVIVVICGAMIIYWISKDEE